MRGRDSVATAVRLPDGSITVHSDEAPSLAERKGWRTWPVLRGMAALYESLFYGTRSLLFSADAAADEKEKLSDREIWLTVAGSLAAAMGLFFALPTAAVHFLPGLADDPVRLNLAEGCLRFFIFILYMISISFMGDIRRVFEYHGAEHKTIFCYEKGLPLTVENVRRQSRFHPRCGTNFLMIVMVISIFAFAFLGWPNWAERILSRLIFIPLIAGFAYEWLRFAADSKNGLVRALNTPGTYLEVLTTREPHDDQIEVAISALKAAAHMKEEES